MNKVKTIRLIYMLGKICNKLCDKAWESECVDSIRIDNYLDKLLIYINEKILKNNKIYNDFFYKVCPVI